VLSRFYIQKCIQAWHLPIFMIHVHPSLKTNKGLLGGADTFLRRLKRSLPNFSEKYSHQKHFFNIFPYANEHKH